MRTNPQCNYRYAAALLLACAFAPSACGGMQPDGPRAGGAGPIDDAHAPAPTVTDLDYAVVEAVLLGDHVTLQELLSRGGSPDARSTGTPALVAAAQAGRVPAARILLEAGASPGATDPRGRTALIVASEKGHLPMLETLLDRGSPIDAADSQGWTALMNAVARNHDDCVQALLAAGARRDAVNSRGQSAADLARLNDRTELEQKLRSNN